MTQLFDCAQSEIASPPPPFTLTSLLKQCGASSTALYKYVPACAFHCGNI